MPCSRQKYTPWMSGVGRGTLDPLAATLITITVHARSRHTSTSAPSVPSARDHLRVGVCEVTVAVDSGAIARGAA